MVTDQDFSLLGFHRLDQLHGFGQCGRNGLLQQGGYAMCKALQRLRYMQGIGRGQHHAIGSVLCQQVVQRIEMACTHSHCDVSAGGGGVNDG